MKHRYLSFLLALFLTAPLTAFAQEAEQEGEAAPAPDEAEATEDEAAEESEEEAAPEPEPEPEVSAVESEMGDPAEGEGESEGWQPSEDSDADEGAAGEGAGEGEGGEGAPPPPGGGNGLRWDLETGRWVEDSEPLPWRNSLFVWNNVVTMDTFLPDGRRTYNPTFQEVFSLRPRWYLAPSISIRLQETLTWELTQQDFSAASTFNNNSAVFSDLQLGIFDTSFFTLPWEIAVGGGVNAFAPLSISSRNSSMILGLQGTVSATKVISEIMTGLTLQVFGSFRGNFFADNVGGLESNAYDTEQSATNPLLPAGISEPNQTGGITNTMVSGQVGIFAGLAPTPEWSFWFQWLNQWNLGYGLADAVAVVDSAPGGTITIPDGSNTHTRVLSFFGVGISWLTNDWVNMTLSYSSFNTALDPDGNVYNPFYNPASTFTLQGVFILDRVYQGVESMLEDDEESEEATARRNDDEESEEDSDGEQVAALRNNRRAAQ